MKAWWTFGIVALLALAGGFLWRGDHLMQGASRGSRSGTGTAFPGGGAVQAAPKDLAGTGGNSQGSATSPGAGRDGAGYAGGEWRAEFDRLIRGRRFEDALRLVEKDLEKESHGSAREFLLLKKAGVLMAMGRYQEAWAALEELVHNGKDWRTIRLALPKLYVVGKSLGSLDAELEALENEKDKASNQAHLLRILATLYALDHQAEKEVSVREALAQQHPDAENLMELSRAYRRQTNFVMAAKAAARLAVVDPERAAEHLLRKATLEAEGNAAEAAKLTCGQVLEVGGAATPVLIQVGHLYAELNDAEKALAAYELAGATAREEFRRERCRLEACRMKIRLGRVDQQVRGLLVGLAGRRKNRRLATCA
jgi:tetratricopeptide (TPR) repeat protein